MKYIILFIASLGLSSPILAQNTPVNLAAESLYSRVYVDDIFFLPDGQTGWIVGNDGSIAKTTDGGIHWRGVPHPGGDAHFTSVFFTDENHGWITSLYAPYILHTNDGGNSWEKQHFGHDSIYLTDIFFVDAQTGWAVGQEEIILHTADGGETWVQQYEQQDKRGGHNYLTNVFFTDTNHGWAIGEYGTILHTNDGGANWNYQARLAQRRASNGTINYYGIWDLNSVHFTDSQTGWIGGSDGLVLFTTNGGETWNHREPAFCADTEPCQKALSTLYILFTDAENGLAMQEDRTILRTENGGAYWDFAVQGGRQHALADGKYEIVTFIDMDHGWLSNETSTILRTQNGGQDFEMTRTDREGDFFRIFFEDGQNGVAIGPHGYKQYSWHLEESLPLYIHHTKNGGQDWEPRRNLQEVRFLYVDAHFSDTQTGWLAGVAGIVAHTRDGGQNWTRQNTGTDRFLHDIEFLNDNVGWAVGTHGTILHTMDGGGNWNLQNTPNAPWLYTVHFVDARNGWAAGGGGAVLRTTDGGATWHALDTGIRSRINDIFFVDTEYGWAIPNTDEIIRTTDGGETWTVLPSPPNHPAARDMQIIFTDRQNGILITSDRIFQTHDGGLSWNGIKETSYPISHLEGGIMVDQNTGWVVGQRGQIIRIRPAN